MPECTNTKQTKWINNLCFYVYSFPLCPRDLTSIGGEGGGRHFFRVTLVRFFFYKNVYCLNFDLRLNQDSTFLFWQHSSMAFHHVLFIHEVLTFNFNLNQVKDYNIVFYFCCMSEFASGQDEAIPAFWLPEQARWAHLARSGFPALVPQEKVLFLVIL